MSAVTRSYSPGVAAGTNLCRPAGDGRLTSPAGRGPAGDGPVGDAPVDRWRPGRTVTVVDR
jgi:hypothetical protein